MCMSHDRSSLGIETSRLGLGLAMMHNRYSVRGNAVGLTSILD